MPLTGVRKKRARKKYGIVGKADLFSGFGDSYADKSTTYSKLYVYEVHPQRGYYQNSCRLDKCLRIEVNG